MFRSNMFEKLEIILNLYKSKQFPKKSGGDAGEIFMVARKIQGEGWITAHGSGGEIGGKGGKISITSENNQFRGNISTKGSKSTA